VYTYSGLRNGLGIFVWMVKAPLVHA
jgi:hypothetical protein